MGWTPALQKFKMAVCWTLLCQYPLKTLAFCKQQQQQQYITSSANVNLCPMKVKLEVYSLVRG